VAISQKTEHRRKKLLAPKMITSTSSIYGKIFILLSFEMKELHKIQSSYETRPGPLSGIPLQGFQNFLNLHLCLQAQVLSAEKVDVNSGTFSKESPYNKYTFRRCFTVILLLKASQK
jgi:hypothetical protein